MRPKYFSPIEVAAHSTLKDLWVSYLGKVYDLTPLAESHQGFYYVMPLHYAILSSRQLMRIFFLFIAKNSLKHAILLGGNF